MFRNFLNQFLKHYWLKIVMVRIFKIGKCYKLEVIFESVISLIPKLADVKKGERAL